jgi:hypothetical protein
MQGLAPEEAKVSCFLWDPSADDVPNATITSETVETHVRTYREEEEELDKVRQSLLPYHGYFIHSLCQSHEHSSAGVERLTPMAAKTTIRRATSRLIETRERIYDLKDWSTVSSLLHSPNASTSTEVDTIRCLAVALTKTHSSLTSEMQALRAEIRFDLAYDRLSLVERRLRMILDPDKLEETRTDASHLAVLYQGVPSELRPPYKSSKTECKALLYLTSRSSEDASDSLTQMQDMAMPCHDCFVPIVSEARERLCRLFQQLGVLSRSDCLPTSLSDASLTFDDDATSKDKAGRLDFDIGSDDDQSGPESEEEGCTDTEKHKRGVSRSAKVEDLADLTNLSDDEDADNPASPNMKKHTPRKRKYKARERSKPHKRPRVISQERTTTATVVEVYNKILSSYQVWLMSIEVLRLTNTCAEDAYPALAQDIPRVIS